MFPEEDMDLKENNFEALKKLGAEYNIKNVIEFKGRYQKHDTKNNTILKK